jgi:hypothetical protein
VYCRNNETGVVDGIADVGIRNLLTGDDPTSFLQPCDKFASGSAIQVWYNNRDDD